MNYFLTSDGRKVSQATINQNLRKSYQAYAPMHPCEACGGHATEHSHIISQARCKVLRKTELIWSRENWFFSCRSCHNEWEAIKGGRWIEFDNVHRLLAVLKRHDPEGYEKRMQVMTEIKLTELAKESQERGEYQNPVKDWDDDFKNEFGEFLKDE